MTDESKLPSPKLLLETLNAFQRTGALKAAIELDLFTAIGSGTNTVKALAEKVNASERGVRILCDYLAAIDFLTKHDTIYRLAPTSASFVDRNSPFFIADAVHFLATDQLVTGFMNAAAAVRKGGSVAGEKGAMAPEHPVWVEYARAMSNVAALSARLLADLLKLDPSSSYKILDIAAGHGMFGITLGKENPKAQIFALDWPNVLKLAKENAAAAGIEDRYQLLAGSAFTVEYGSGYDIVLLTNFLHHFDAPACESVLAKVYNALKPGGRVATLEFVPDEDRVSPPEAATFAMVMLVNTPTGDAHRFSDLEKMFKNVGFSRNQLFPLTPSPQSVLVSYKD